MGAEDQALWSVDRRGFLTLSAGLAAALSLAVAGAGGCQAAQIPFPEGTCGGKKEMDKRVLVAYASKYGSTGGVADAIGKELCGRDVAADVLMIKKVRNISAYRAVVVGSAIYMGKWMSEALDFIKENRDVLRQVPVAYFLVCMNLAEPTEAKRAEVSSYTDPVLRAVPEIRPVGIGTFAGALDYHKLSWIYRKILKSKETPEGDFRDWNAIRGWARDPVLARISR